MIKFTILNNPFVRQNIFELHLYLHFYEDQQIISTKFYKLTYNIITDKQKFCAQYLKNTSILETQIAKMYIMIARFIKILNSIYEGTKVKNIVGRDHLMILCYLFLLVIGIIVARLSIKHTIQPLSGHGTEGGPVGLKTL